MIKYLPVYTLLLIFVFYTSCGQNPTNLSKENIKSETKDVSTSKWIYTRYEYTDSAGKSLTIQNSFPKGGIFWTRIINETDNPLELTIDFSGDSYELPSSVGSPVDSYFKIIVPSDTMTRDKEDLFGYGLTDFDSFLDNSIHKRSSSKRTINPKESNCFYVLMLFIKPKSGWQRVKGDGNGTTRTGFSLKGQNLFYTVNGKEIHCGKINLKSLILKK